jgi:hypothetical protein
MTHKRDFDRLARAWLELGPNEAPDRAVAAVLQATATTPQMRRRFGWPIAASLATGRVARAIGAAAVLLVLIGGAILLSQRNQPPVAAPVASPSLTPSPSPQVSPSASAVAAAEIVLQRSPANLGCDSLPPGYRSVTIRIDPASDVYLDIVNPAFDGTTDKVNVDVWAEVDPLPSGSPDPAVVEPLPAGTRLAVYWPPGFTATDGDTPVIRGLRGEEVVRDGTRLDAESAGYFSCGGRESIYVLDYQPG